MKQLLTILLVLGGIAAFGQQPGKIYPSDNDAYGVKYPRGAFTTALHVPTLQDTTSIRDNSKYKDSAEIGIFQGALWYKPARGYWKKSGDGNGGGGIIIENDPLALAALRSYYNRTQSDSLYNILQQRIAAKPDSIDLIIDNSTIIGSGTNADPLRVNPSNLGNASTEQAPTFSAIDTTDKKTRIIEVATDETNGGKTTYYAYNNKVSPNTLERFTTTAVIIGGGSQPTAPGNTLKTTDGAIITTTNGETIIFN